MNIWDWISIFFYRFIQSPYYWIKNYLFHRYDLVRSGLNPGSWCDKVELMLYSNMQMLVDFVEKEKCFDVVLWEDDHKVAGQTIKELYAWWKNHPTRLKEIDDMLSKWHDTAFDHSKPMLDQMNSEQSPEARVLFDELHKLEKALQEEEQENLKRLIDIRFFLWT